MEVDASTRATYRSNRRRQILRAIPHYLTELRRVRNPAELYSWWQFKLPYTVPLPAFPPRITLELTNRCNFACPHCHRSSMNREIGTMDFALLQRIVTEIGNNENSLVKIGGLGEPSIYPRCAEFMELLRDRGVNSIFYTNGTLLHRFDHDRILNWRIPHLVVSIDGIDRETYQRARVGGNYDRLQTALGRFHERRAKLGYDTPLIEVRHVILPRETRADLSGFRSRWLKVADTVMFNHLIPAGPIENGAHPPSRKCRDIRREMYVRWNGKVPVCGIQYLVDKNQWLVDLHESTIEEAWQHPVLNQRRCRHLEGANAIPVFCAKCPQTA